ncbi:aldehyde dehydrogenase family protein [Gammaproteobacteria bacterium]|nr:aldehyde dehydrogenase family protein [Gammaproteobacteria bacterium]
MSLPLRQFYINGQWVDPSRDATIDVINPATESVTATIAAGCADDIDAAVAAARAAFPAFAASSVGERLALLQAIIASYAHRAEDLAQATTREMGAPITASRRWQVSIGKGHLKSAVKALEAFAFESEQNGTLLRYEPIGVVGMITPWNWPLNQIVSKVAPAIAAGCTMVLKPSEESPLSALIFAEIMDDAGVPAGVFNLVNGDGPTVGEAMSRHPDIDMMSFTGSTRGGVAVAKAAADSVKRVSQELGGKSPNIILPDADLAQAVADGLLHVMDNSGQSCNAPTRMLIPHAFMDDARAMAAEVVDSLVIGDPSDEATTMGPVINRSQFEKIQGLIQVGIDEGATLAAGGLGLPEPLDSGYYVRPTVFTHVTNDMRIAREEIFGPVVCVLGYESEDEAIAIANDTEYGLAAYVSSSDPAHATAVARQLRAGQVAVNYRGGNCDTPFGGYKRSGNGREKGVWGLHDMLELKAITGV